ncbi:hypothetical protein NP493_4773g00002 [Ridgeia piscesae]|uniref:Uncharacterized protein n=1 Tax=Ridgeia piscesae TaxID=27915 RepID=A0AAD9MR74_RIDPI|nr:hypothetical protein NP493_4773g00002 [Ridgeia piscesae]
MDSHCGQRPGGSDKDVIHHSLFLSAMGWWCSVFCSSNCLRPEQKTAMLSGFAGTWPDVLARAMVPSL